VFGLRKSLVRLALVEIGHDSAPSFHDLVALPEETEVALPGRVLE
jgi:hypothetical protein